MSLTLERLWQLARERAMVTGARHWSGAFEPIGLILHESVARAPLNPGNALAFASTGGDGVRFSFLVEGDSYDELTPVVMTVPMMAKTVVVGSNLREFMCLGSRLGFFFLEQLVYQKPAFLAAYESGGNEGMGLMTDDQQLLDTLVAALGLKPWTELDRRLEELRRQYEERIAPPSPYVPSELPKGAEFWRAMLDREMTRPAAERDASREEHMRQRLEAEIRKTAR
jgi:hypothetical protein